MENIPWFPLGARTRRIVLGCKQFIERRSVAIAKGEKLLVQREALEKLLQNVLLKKDATSLSLI